MIGNKNHVIYFLGRPNVGKSSLINAILKKRIQIVSNIEGTTIDLIYRTWEENGKILFVVDTKGIESVADLASFLNTVKPKFLAFVVDASNLIPLDFELWRHLRRYPVHSILVANKSDLVDVSIAQNILYKLGSRDGFSVSAKLGSGIKELRDKLILLSDQKTSKTLRLCSVALVGRTNVGKSALFNSLMSRVNAPFHSKVCPDAHTTRDFVEGYINYKRLTIRVLDCAGFKRGLPRLKLEAYVMDRIRMALELSEIIVLVLSGDEFVTSFDRRILSKLEASGKKLIIVVNKWDLGKIHFKDSDFRRELPEYYPILFVSALYKKNLNILLETIYQLFHRSLKIEEIERVCFEISRAYPAPFRGNAINCLEKVIFDEVNSTVKLKFKFPELIKRNYLRAFEKKFRSELDTSGMCLKFSLLQSKNL